MSNYMFVVVPGIRLPPEANEEVAAYVKRECAGAVPHNHLSHFRVVVRSNAMESTLEPIFPGDCAETIIAAVVRWAEQKHTPVSIRMEGHRGNQPLPPLERSAGTISDALSFRPRGRKPYNVEFALRGDALRTP
jgi:hypothetical protein